MSAATWTETDVGWISRPEGWDRLRPGLGGDHYLLINEVSGKWRLTECSVDSERCGSGTRSECDDLWEADTAAECRRMARFIVAHRAAPLPEVYSDPEKRTIRRPTSVPGVTLEISNRGTEPYRVVVIERNGDGSTSRSPVSSVVLTGWKGSWVLGERTVNGDSYLPDHLRRRGIGAVVYDMTEEFFGLPRAPHGRNWVGGSLSPQASRFWEKRAAAGQHVPGFQNPEVDGRCLRMAAVQRMFSRETVRRTDPDFAALLSIVTGFEFETKGSRDGSGVFVPEAAWTRPLADGRIFTGKGIEKRADLLRHVFGDDKGDEQAHCILQMDPVDYLDDTLQWIMDQELKWEAENPGDALDASAVTDGYAERLDRLMADIEATLRRHLPDLDISTGMQAATAQISRLRTSFPEPAVSGLQAVG